MSDWISNAKPPLPPPCEHNETGLCPSCVLDFVKAAALTADVHLKGVADSAVDVMRKLQWERDEARKELANARQLLDDDLRAVTDIPARRQCDTCSLVHENCVEINTGEGPDRANSATLCGHCVETIRRELATVVRERDEARATIADFHKSRIRKQTEREAAMDAELTRLARTVDRKDEQMAELQEHLIAAEAATHEQAKMLRALKRERDEARAERDYEHAQLMKMSEHEIALCEDLFHRGGPITCGVCGGNHLTLTHFEAPAPARPATAAKDDK